MKTGEESFRLFPRASFADFLGRWLLDAHAGVRLARGALMALSVLDLFSVGIGPSSSHTVGPMRAAKLFADGLKADGHLSSTARVQAELFGSLGATGRGHGSDKAVVLGLQGLDPETVDTATADDQVAAAALDAELRIGGDHRVDFNWDEDVVLHRRKSLPAHPNGMTFRALDHDGAVLQRTELSTRSAAASSWTATPRARTRWWRTARRCPSRSPRPTNSWSICQREGMSISDVMLANELAWRSEAELRESCSRSGPSCANAWTTAAPRKASCPAA